MPARQTIEKGETHKSTVVTKSHSDKENQESKEHKGPMDSHANKEDEGPIDMPTDAYQGAQKDRGPMRSMSQRSDKTNEPEI